MFDFWYISYIFLGLSLSIGVAVYYIYRGIKKKQEERRRHSPLRQLEEEFLNKDKENGGSENE